MKPLFILTLALTYSVHSSTTTAQSNWTFPPIQISTPGVDASEPQIDIDINGNAVAIWIEQERVISKNIPYGGQWGSANTLSGAGASSPKISIDLNGNATAIWVENGFIQTSTQPFNAPWGSITTLSSNGASSPQLCIDESGNIVTIWVRDSFIESATKPFDRSWPVSPDVISGAGADSPQLASKLGHIIAVWNQVENSINTIYSNQKLIEGNWGTPVAISAHSQNCINPKVALDNLGNVAAIWFRYNLLDGIYSDVYLQASSKNFNETWSVPKDLSENGCYNPYYLVSKVAFDGNGNVVANWNNSYDGATFWYEASVKTKNKNWSQVLGLEGQNLCAYSLDLSVDSYGHAVTTFMTYDSFTSAINILSRKMNINALYLGWSLTYAQFSIGAYNAYPTLNIIANGPFIHLASAWMNYDGTNDIVHATTGLGYNYPPPTNLKVTQSVNNFYLFDEHYNTFSWSPSLNPSTLGYFIYRNGQLINSVPANILQIIDDNQPEHGQVTYGVAAYDNNYEQSSVVYVSYP